MWAGAGRWRRRVVVSLVLVCTGCSSAPVAGRPAPPATSPTAPKASSATPAAAAPSATAPGSPSARAPESPSQTPSAAGSPRAGREVTVVLTGDVLLHEALWAQAARDARASGRDGLDFRPLLRGIRRYVRPADLAVCHLETPLARSLAEARGYPLFAVPQQIVPALADTGYDACTTASNHSFDEGAAGIDRTLRTLDRAGIAHAGTARSPAEARRTTLLEVAGTRVALLSYTYGFNGLPYPHGQTWRAALIDERRIRADARRARQRGADLVLVGLHWGSEYDQEPDSLQRRLGARLLRSPDIDLVYGHHAHVVQPIRPVGGEWLVYGLGNLVAHHATPGEPNEEGLLVQLSFRQPAGARRWTAAVSYVPLLVTHEAPIRVLDVAWALRSGHTGAATADRLRLAWERTTRVVESMGGRKQGLRPAMQPG